jgi:hypothetical protein
MTNLSSLRHEPATFRPDLAMIFRPERREQAVSIAATGREARRCVSCGPDAKGFRFKPRGPL